MLQFHQRHPDTCCPHGDGRPTYEHDSGARALHFLRYWSWRFLIFIYLTHFVKAKSKKESWIIKQFPRSPDSLSVYLKSFSVLTLASPVQWDYLTSWKHYRGLRLPSSRKGKSEDKCIFYWILSREKSIKNLKFRQGSSTHCMFLWGRPGY